jgi:signal transduction histidine kinase
LTNRISNIVFAFFASLIGAMFIYTFYASPMRERVENKLYDIRTRLALGFSAEPRIVTVSIGPKTVAASADPGADKGRVSFQTIKKLVQKIQATNAKSIAVLLIPQANPYTDEDLSALVELSEADPRIVFGTFGLTLKGKGRSVFPDSFKPETVPAFKADILRDYRREVVRSYTVWQKGELPFLPWAIAVKIAPERVLAIPTDPEKNEKKIQINYHRDTIKDIEAEEVLEGRSGNFFDNKIVFVGYSTYHQWNSLDRESSHANSPWQEDGDDVEKSMPVTEITAIVTSNLISGNWLTSPPAFVNGLQTVVLVFFGFIIWRLSIGFASILFIGTWSLLLLAHAFIFKTFAISVPLADCLLLSSMATIAGAMWRLRLEALLRLEQEAKIVADAELAKIEDRFLNRFTEELGSLNTKTKEALDGLNFMASASGTPQTAYLRAVESNNELSDYLVGIRQFAALQEHHLKTPNLQPINLRDEIDKVVKQFDTRCIEQKVVIEINSNKSEMVLSDQTLLRQIIYNLVSNAVKYSPEQSTVQLSVVHYRNSTIFVVKDNGPGIAPEYHEKIFEKFYRIKDDRVYKVKGHGLGLYLSRYFSGIVGAELKVTSAVGTGAEFRLIMKRAQRKESAS